MHLNPKVITRIIYDMLPNPIWEANDSNEYMPDPIATIYDDKRDIVCRSDSYEYRDTRYAIKTPKGTYRRNYLEIELTESWWSRLNKIYYNGSYRILMIDMLSFEMRLHRDQGFYMTIECPLSRNLYWARGSTDDKFIDSTLFVDDSFYIQYAKLIIDAYLDSSDTDYITIPYHDTEAQIVYEYMACLHALETTYRPLDEYIREEKGRMFSVAWKMTNHYFVCDVKDEVVQTTNYLNVLRDMLNDLPSRRSTNTSAHDIQMVIERLQPLIQRLR